MKTNTIKNFAMRFVAVIAAVLLAGNAWGANAVYTVTSTSAVSASNAPANSSSSYANTYTTNYQTTSGNTATLTLTSLGGISISNITLSMHSNSGNGTGMLSYSTDGGSNWTYLVGSSGSGVTFDNSAWNGRYTTSWVDISKNVNLNNVTQLKVRIEVTYKSLYCQSFTISYSAGCSTKLTITKAGQTNGTFSLRAGAANGSELTGTGKNEIGNCSSQTVYVVPSPATGYVASACTATNKTSGPTASGSNWYIVYPSANSNTSSTVTVTFSGKQCALVFNQNNGTGGQSSNLTATYGSAMPTISETPTREHYNFLGYYDGTGNTATQYYTSTGASARNWDKNTTSNTTLYARWEEKGIARYVTNCCTPLGAIGGSVALTQSGSDIVVDGWNATTGGNETGYLVRLYNSDMSSVITSANTGSKATKNHTFTNPGAGTYWVSVSPTYDGEGSFCDAGDETFSATSITLTGKVNITFKKNGATGTDDQVQAVDYDTETALEDVSERGYTALGCKEFGGWASSEDNAAAGTVAYANGANITATEPVVLWAIWNTKTFAISDGTIDDASVASHSYSVNTIDCGGTLTITCAPTNAYKGNPTVTASGTHGTITVVSATEVTIANVQSAMAVSIAYETAKENYEVTWNVNGAETKKSFVEGTTFATIMADASKPSVADYAVFTNCDADKFMGWATALIDKDNAASSDVSWYDGEATLSGKQTFYAVWAKKSTSQGDPKPILNEPFTGFSNNYNPSAPGSSATKLKDSDMSYTCNPNNNSGTRIQTSGGPTGGSTGNNIIIKSDNGYFRINDIPTDDQTSLTLSYRETGSGTLSVTSTTTGVTVGNPTEDGTLYTHTISIPANTETFVLKFTNTSGSYNLRIDDINISYTPSVTTYSNYITECCVPLTTVNEKISIGNIAEGGARASWSWSGATTGISKNVLKVYNTSDVCVKTIDNISASATQQDITGLTPCTEYYVTLTTVKSSGYCDGEEQGKSDNFTTNPWAVHYSGGDETEGALLSNVTKLSGGEGACTNANYVATFQADAGYLLPNSIIVYIAGIEVTAGVDYTWAVSEGIGTLTIFTSELSEEIDVRIIGVERPSYTVTIVNPEHGTITVMNGESAVSSGSSVKVGSILTLSGTGNTAAYRVVDFSAYKTGDQSTAVDITSNTLTMPEYAITITAGEEELIPAYIAVAEGQSTWGMAQIGVYGSVEPGAGPVYIDDQEELLLVATPNEGYAFVNWTADGIASYNNAQDATTTAMIGESRTFTANFQPIVATPTFTSATGTYYDNATVELSCATADATIRYTLDGSEPTSTSGEYSAPFAVTSTKTVKAKAFKDGCKESATASVTYTIGYTVKWSVNGNDAYSAGVTDENNKVASGGTVSVPTAPADNLISGCANKFIGWSKKNFTFEEGKDADDYDDLFSETSPAITGPTTFYAVFATQDGSPEGFTLVSTASNFTDGKYVAACLSYNTYYFVDGTTGTNGIGVETTGLASASVTEGSFLLSALPSGAVIMDIEDNGTPSGEDHYYYLSYTSGNTTKYLDDTGSGSSLNWTTNTSVHTYHPNFTQKTTNGCVLLSSSGSKVSQNGSSKDDFIRNYASTGNYYNDIYFFKKTGNGYTYSNYVTMCDNTKAYVTYDLDGGSVTGDACASGQYTKEGFKTCATEPTKTGYDFAGWNDGTNTHDADVAFDLTQDTTLTAQWTAKDYTITYDTKGGDAVASENYTIEAAHDLAATATKGSDKFVGWHAEEDLSDDVVTSIPEGSTGDKTFYAEWVSRYEIVFDVNGQLTTIYRASDESLEATVAGMGSVPTPTAPSLCGKSFAGWSENIQEEETNTKPADLIVNATGTVSGNKHYYAVWANASLDDITETYGFEDNDDASLWTIDEAIAKTSGQGNGSSSYAGKINTNNTYITFKDKVKVKEFSFAFKKTSDNNNYNVYIETSENGTSWTAETYAMSTFNNGSYLTKTKTFDGETALYVRFHCYNTTAVRYVDDVTITYKGYRYTNYTTACHVTAASEQTVNVEEANTISSLTVKQDGTVNLDANLIVNDFTIEAMEGHSGQVLNPNNLQVNGNAYYDLTLNASGTMNHDLWYAFAVPFQVDAATGIQRLSNDGVASPAQFNGHYVLLKYNSGLRASSGNGWEYVTAGEKLTPGNFYMVALNSNAYNRLRMTKDAGNLNNQADLTLATTSGSAANKNWNALANNALSYANVSATGDNATCKVQTYISNEDKYDVFTYGEVTFTVGTPFFIQVAASGTMNVVTGETEHSELRAPQREALATEEFIVRLGENTTSYYDKLYVSASDEALNEYQIGHDLAKAGVSTKVPQMYVPAYGTQLCDAEFPLINNEARFPLTFTTPNAGTYQLYVAVAAQDAELYLLQNDNVIWDLTLSPYALTLPQGTTEGYGLLLKAKAPNAATGVDEINAEVGAQKVIIDEHVYILRGGQMYDVNGKMVK